MESIRRRLGRVGVVFVFVQLAMCVSAQDCLQAAGGRATPSRVDGSPRLPSGTQAIITSYKFGCCGNITAWQTYVQPGGKKHQRVYDITFQVWRPSPTVQENGCYSLVGANRFTSLSLGEGGLVSETPQLSKTLTVQPMDVVGYFTFSRKARKRRMAGEKKKKMPPMEEGIQLDTSRSMDTVWYRTNTESDPLTRQTNCPFPVGTDTDRSLTLLTKAGPVLSVDLSTFTCPSTPTITSPSSSSQPPSQSPSRTPSMIDASPSVSAQVSDMLPQGSPTPTPLLSIASELTTTPGLSIGMSKLTTTPGLSIGMSKLTTTPGLSIGMSKLSGSPTSGTIQPTASSTPNMSPVDDKDSLGGVIAAGVLVVIILGMSLLIVLIVVLLIWRRNRSQKAVKVEVSGNGIDLSNPSYDYSSLSSLLKRQSRKKPQTPSTKAPYQPPPIPLTGPDMATTMYESIDAKRTLDYTSPKAVADSSLSNIYSSIPDSPGKGEVGGSAEDEDALYHAVGPSAKWYATDGKRNGSAVPPPCPPLVPVRNNTGQSAFRHMLEGAVEDSFAHYEDPTLPNLKKQNPSKRRGLFDSTGYYVPTDEQRKRFGSNYEQQYETTSETYNKLNFFEEEQIYWAPAGTASGLYGQLASKKYREIQRDQIRMMEKLGAGQFGEVCKALWTVGGHTLELAVKTLNPGASEEDKVKFLQEAAINGQFSHSNVIKMHGIVTLGEPVLICLEILANGDLRSYLQSLELRGSKHRDFMEAQIMFLKFAKDIAAGMEYLSKKSFVHRDLAARNILLDKSLTCKVADFGMARDLMDDTYYTSSGGKIPVKWTAPEALLYKKYSADSDVWSYGMVLFEIWSVAKKPFSTISNNQVLRLIQKGFCQAPPPGCPRAVYELMVDCWNPDHPSRPSFSKISSSYLQQSSAKILYWAPKDETLSPAVGVCGAPLEEAHKLHLDLQEKYKNCGKIF